MFGLVHRLDRPTRAELWYLQKLQKQLVGLVSKLEMENFIKNICVL